MGFRAVEPLQTRNKSATRGVTFSGRPDQADRTGGRRGNGEQKGEDRKPDFFTADVLHEQKELTEILTADCRRWQIKAGGNSDYFTTDCTDGRRSAEVGTVKFNRPGEVAAHFTG